VPVRLFSETGITTVFTNLDGFSEDWKENPEACVRFVREYQCPSFLEYGEYPYVTADEIKKALRRKAAFSDMLDQMCWIGCSRPPMCKPRWTAPTAESRWRSHGMGSARWACPADSLTTFPTRVLRGHGGAGEHPRGHRRLRLRTLDRRSGRR
jgi:hypothetical protein